MIQKDLECLLKILLREIKMKKIILLIIILLCSGCYDYQEINNMAIINGIGVDYQNEEYILTLEILNIQEKKESTETQEKSYALTARGKTINEAMNNVESIVTKKASFSHLEIILISEDLAKKGITDICDYFLRNNFITNNLYLVLAKNKSPEEILKNKSQSEKINTVAIVELLESKNSTFSLSIKDEFDYQVAKIKDNFYDIFVLSVNLEDEIKLDQVAVFKGDKLKFYLTEDEKQILGLLANKIYNIVVVNEMGAMDITKDKVKINYDGEKYIIEIDLLAKLEKLNDEELYLKNRDDLSKLESSFRSTLEDRINDLIDSLYRQDTDILGLKKVLYNKNPKEDLSNWQKKRELKVKLHINRFGSLFEDMP